MRPSTRRTIRFWSWVGVFLCVAVVVLCNRWVENSTKAYLYDYGNWALLPENDVGLVLGTSAYTGDGDPSPYFQGRIRAAAELYKLGKVKVLIVSGANPDASYNEPRKMWQELVKAGVPQSAIKMDFAGYRTLDSIVRAQAVWGQTRFTVITQRFHAFRAVFLGRQLGFHVIGYLAPIGLTGDNPGKRNPVREIFARFTAVLDIVLLDTQPKYLGNPELLQTKPEELQPAPSDGIAPPPS